MSTKVSHDHRSKKGDQSYPRRKIASFIIDRIDSDFLSGWIEMIISLI